MYIKKKDKELFQELEENLSMPCDWNQFILEKSIKNKLIIKEKKNFQCTNCGAIFQSKLKSNDLCKCPNCQNVYVIKTSRLKNYSFKNELAIFEKYKTYYIERMFRLEISYKNGEYSNVCYEYARRIYGEQFKVLEEIVNENVVGAIGGQFIKLRNFKSTAWRYFRSYSSYLPDVFYYYPNNLKELLKVKEKLKYSQLWELVKHVECNLSYLIKNYNPCIEYLTKLKLYNLALCPKTFFPKKSFSEKFCGLSKDYLPFMQEYNVTYDELHVLSFLKYKDINVIQKFVYISQEDLGFVSEYVDLAKLFEKTDLKKTPFYEYRDYLNLAIKLKLNLKDKQILYPKNIKVAHDRLVKEYKQQKDEKIQKEIKKRYQKLKKNQFEYNGYIVFPAKDLDSLIDESSQQNNCVRSYAESIAQKKCDVYFMRLSKDKNKSLVTIEVKNNKIVQKRTKNNERTTKKQDKFLNLWERKILGGE